MRHLPNLICLLRIALIWPIVAALEAGAERTALALFVAAALSDGLDGYLAKRFGWTSALGKSLDPLADKLLLIVLYVVCAWRDLVPWWLAAAVVARDVLIGLGAAVYRLGFGPLNGRPTLLSKVNTAAQLGYLALVLLDLAVGIPPLPALSAVARLVFVTTLLSGAHYVVLYARRAAAQSPQPV